MFASKYYYQEPQMNINEPTRRKVCGIKCFSLFYKEGQGEIFSTSNPSQSPFFKGRSFAYSGDMIHIYRFCLGK
jgi:hypothetical protein